MTTHERAIAWLRADTINLHPDYQRALNVTWAKKIAKDFDPELLLPILVSCRADGSLHCIGGQHRLYAFVTVLGWGAELVECDVYRRLTLEQEAALHDATSRVKAHSQLERFRVRVSRGDPLARQLEGILSDCGLAIATNHSSTEGVVRAVTALEQIRDEWGSFVLQNALRLLVDAYGPDTAAFKQATLKGTAAFVLRYWTNAAFDRAQLVERLRAKGLYALEQRAVALRQAGISGSHGAYASIGKAMLGFYNAGRRTRQLPEWKEFVTTPEKQANLVATRAAQGKRAGFGNPKIGRAHV